MCVFQLTGMLQYVVRQSTEVEARFNSVERLQEYIKVRLRKIKTVNTQVSINLWMDWSS